MAIINLKELLYETLLNSLMEFSEDKAVKIVAANTIFPEVDEIRSALNTTTNPLDTYVIFSSGKRETRLHRTNAFEDITVEGEYVYYYHSEDSMLINATCFTNTQEASDQVLDYLSHFCAGIHLLPCQGRDITDEDEQEYYIQYFTYQYYNPDLYCSVRLESVDYEQNMHEGELWTVDYTFKLYIKRMIAVRYPLIDEIVISDWDETQSGSIVSGSTFTDYGFIVDFSANS